MLKHIGHVTLPPHEEGGFDHGDVHLNTGKVFVAHTANGAIEVIDGVSLRHIKTIPGCPEASGVLCAQTEGIVFAASRATGRILLIDAHNSELMRVASAGSKPNGLAWDTRRRRLLVADVGDNSARIIETSSNRVLATVRLPGRPRWCTYDKDLDILLLNIRDPPGVQLVEGESLSPLRFLQVSVAGPHGLDLDPDGRAFVACDGKAVVALDLNAGREISTIPIAGEPDVIWNNPRRERLYCAIGRPGVIDVIDTRRLRLIEEIQTEGGAHTLAFDLKRQRLYSFLPGTCHVSVYEES